MKVFASLYRVGAIALLPLLLFACSKPEAAASRRVKFYQSPMHPWITSDHPGNCTICGMALVPVYEGDKDSTAPGNLVTLNDASLRVLGVASVPVRRMDLTRTLRFSGIYEDDDNLHRVIAAFYDGRIERVYIEHVGQYVEKGTPLAAIYSPELLYVVREYQTALQSGNQNVVQTSARRLVQYGLTSGQVAALVNRKEAAYTIDLLAPISGTVLSRDAYDGQYIKTGQPLFQMGNLSRLWFHAEVYERDIASVHEGQKVALISPAVPGRELPGVVTFIDPDFDAATRSTKVRIEVDNPVEGGDGSHPRYLLPHRSYGEARIAADFGAALVVPRSAVIRDGTRSLVYVEKSPGSYEPRKVTVGRSGDEGIEIVGGLREGERVVSEGNLMIDAESQLRGGVEAVPSPPASKPAMVPPAGAVEFLAQLARVSASLAADDAVAAVTAAKPLPALAQAMAETKEPAVAAAVRAVRALGSAPSGEDLRSIRKSFLPWSQAGAALAGELATQGAAPGVSVFECPMTANSFPDAPSQARWVQVGKETRNPYLGVEMLTCGAEVKP